MASVAPKPDMLPVADPTQDSELDETAITDSLARLQQLHIALRNLRQTLPSVVDSILPPSTPEQLYSNFAAAAQTAGKDIRDFTTLLQDKQTRDVLERARKSKEEDAAEIGCWRVEEHADWLDDTRQQQQLGENSNDAMGASMNVDRAEEREVQESDIKGVVERFNQMDTGTTVDALDESRNRLQVRIPPPASLDLWVEWKREGDGPLVYIVGNDRKSKFQRTVLEVVNSQTGNRGLVYVLVCVYPRGGTRAEHAKLTIQKEMLSTYRDVQTRPCEKCSRLLDRSAQFPILRTKKPRSSDPGQQTWSALHPSCNR
ncbi:MAG: hypothetical protein OHK93_004196 [Ramalina farinacea]|uniref:Mediator complex subunit 27 n=1 Tax=Ramalina farinacea TaxID=258253 RepID=A0AA43QHY7_9LECA|nr:hypothetical protein [Ramalina farinacea]